MFQLNVTIQLDPDQLDQDDSENSPETTTLKYFNYSRDDLVFDAGRIYASRFDVLAIDLIDLDANKITTLFDIELDDLPDLEP